MDYQHPFIINLVNFRLSVVISLDSILSCWWFISCFSSHLMCSCAYLMDTLELNVHPFHMQDTRFHFKHTSVSYFVRYDGPLSSNMCC